MQSFCNTATYCLHGRMSAVEQSELVCRLKAEVKLWASQLKISGNAEVKILLAEVDSIKRDLTNIDAACFDLQKQVKGLQDSRREMLAQVHNMVPRLELENAQAEVAMLLGTVKGMQRDAEAALQEKIKLVSSLQVLLTQITCQVQCSAVCTSYLAF
jgi:hypothetical protein